jgi:hypothetical protein
VLSSIFSPASLTANPECAVRPQFQSAVDERRALRVAAEITPGVRGIEDHTEFAPSRALSDGLRSNETALGCDVTLTR